MSALDPELVGEVLAVIKDLATQGWTTVIVESGPPAQVIGDPREERTRRFLRRVLDHG